MWVLLQAILNLSNFKFGMKHLDLGWDIHNVQKQPQNNYGFYKFKLVLL
jgi:hypothetical protein